MVNAAQVLEVEEVQRGRGLRVAGGADHLLRRVDHISGALEVDGDGAALQNAMRERGKEEGKCPSQTKQEGAGGRGTSSKEGARSSDMSSEKPSRSVRWISTGSGEADC